MAVLVGVIYPAYIFATYKKVNRSINKDGKFRLVDYKQTLLLFWGLTLLILANYFVHKQPQLDFLPTVTLPSIGLTVLILVLAYLQYRTTKVTADTANVAKEKLKDIYHYLPKSAKELYWFGFLAVSAGICEEVIFRMFLFGFLKENSNLAIAFLVANLIFAITHIGSGKSNLLSSFVLGLLFSAIYYFTDNIWIAIILHTSIDINAGILGYRINRLTETSS